MTTTDPTWRLAIDTGGTFTDCIAVAPDGRVMRIKTLSSGALRARVDRVLNANTISIRADWLENAAAIAGFTLGRTEGAPDASVTVTACTIDGELSADRLSELPCSIGDVIELTTGEPSPIIAARLATRTPFPESLPPMRLRLATTRGTNALLERTHAPTAFFVTEGFADLLDIGDQRRPQLFALDIRKSRPLHGAAFEMRERIDADGNVILELDEDIVRTAATEAAASGFRVAAVALAHSWRNATHERRVRDILLESGFEHVSLSSDLSRTPKLLPRARTAVVNAGLSPILETYLSSVSHAAAHARLDVMTSAGGLSPAAEFRPVQGLLSGPAGGVVGAAMAGKRAGASRIISFDMGGTSTDVARIEGQPELTFEHTVGDATLLAPAVRIETVAAGGGSICGFDGDRPFVGPRSAGADPGPACYGAGGPLTVTDVNLLLGRIDPAQFGIPLDGNAAERALTSVMERAGLNANNCETRDQVLQGFFDLANEHMAEAIRRISVRAGYDPADYTLVAFGGAGPQHACAVAARLGCTSVIVPTDASLLSAVGVHHSPMERLAERSVLTPLPPMPSVLAMSNDLARQALNAFDSDILSKRAQIQRLVELRLAGQSFTITVDWDGAAPLRELFFSRHEATFGFVPNSTDIELVALRLVARIDADDSHDAPHIEPHDSVTDSNENERTAHAWFSGRREVPVHDRVRLGADAHVHGPALILESHSVTVVEHGWTAKRGEDGALKLDFRGDAAPIGASSQHDIIRHELIAHRLDACADQMGAMLQRAALSTNVKERLDFSCALLDAKGEVVASAPHIPVHLGALGHCVRRIVETTTLNHGDVIVTNHPAFGGSHLPDVTVVAPVHAEDGTLLGYSASRAHHAEIGGIRPGSMPPGATTLVEEGVVIPPTHLVRAGVTDWAAITTLLTTSAHPTRALRENLSDLAAALAAARFADDALRRLANEFGRADVFEAMERVLERSNRAVVDACAARAPLEATIDDALDDGAPIRGRVQLTERGAVIDLTGSAPTHAGNLNAPLVVVHSTVAYVMRLLIDEPVPINDGLLRSVRLIVPEGMLNPVFTDDPATCPAVAGGNVETSQRLINALLREVSDVADSQGTMNNVIIGDETFSYYETLAGGAGATAQAPGASAVHTHMTNTAITDPEIFELRYPVRIAQTRIRRGSGGAGAHRGGDGLIRELEFLRPLDVSVLTQNRVRGPRGAAGGNDGSPGAQTLIRSNGDVLKLNPTDGVRAEIGDRLIIETPGGGGWGPPPPGD